MKLFAGSAALRSLFQALGQEQAAGLDHCSETRPSSGTCAWLLKRQSLCFWLALGRADHSGLDHAVWDRWVWCWWMGACFQCSTRDFSQLKRQGPLLSWTSTTHHSRLCLANCAWHYSSGEVWTLPFLTRFGWPQSYLWLDFQLSSVSWATWLLNFESTESDVRTGTLFKTDKLWESHHDLSCGDHSTFELDSRAGQWNLPLRARVY